jgi:hypothetical protein
MTEPKSHTIVCAVCLSDAGDLNPAERVSEGAETDEYLCQKEKHTFGLDKSDDDSLAWPPSAELKAAASDLKRRRGGHE